MTEYNLVRVEIPVDNVLEVVGVGGHEGAGVMGEFG